MIKMLLVLNSVEGHRFEVGEPYVYSKVNQVVKEITQVGLSKYEVKFEDGSFVDIVSNDVMLFQE